MSFMLLTLIGLVIAVIVIGGIVALVVFLINRNKSQTDGDQNLDERVRSL
jgi:type II secretory pathway pseudopilin PulG